MKWWAIEVRPHDQRRDAVAQRLAELTRRAVEQRPAGSVVGVTTSEGAGRTIVTQLRREFGGDLSSSVAVVTSVDWSRRWRDGMTVRSVGRLRIGPSWLLEPDARSVVIDPEMAFGTGEHGSTRGVIGLLDRQLRPGGRMLDIGSGTGIVAIAAARLGAARAVGIEIDDDAESIAEANARRNGVASTVRFVTGDAATLVPLLGPADLVASNILRSVNQMLLPTLLAALAPDGVVLFGGMEVAERELFLPSLYQAGCRVVDEQNDAGWWAVAATGR